jgi:lambda repressor-like predicted transcriptional regulator
MTANPVARIRRITKELERHQGRIADLSAEREELMRQLRSEGWSLGRLATETGLSRSRVQQICDPAD